MAVVQISHHYQSQEYFKGHKMPGLDFQNLPAAQVREIKSGLHGQWEIEANALNKTHFSDRGKFETAKAKLNAKYQQMELTAITQLQGQVAEQQRVRQLIQHPQERSRVDEAQLRMELRPEAERLVFPETQAGGAPYAQARLEQYAETMREFAGRAEEKEGWEWGPPEKIRESLESQYEAWQHRYGYAGMKLTQKNQMDDLWDAVMQEGKKAFKQWDPLSVDVKALRARGQVSKTMAKRVTGTPTKYDTTPLGQSIAEKTEKKPEPRQEPIRQRNRKTNQERISYDGGKTWQMIGSQ